VNKIFFFLVFKSLLQDVVQKSHLLCFEISKCIRKLSLHVFMFVILLALIVLSTDLVRHDIYLDPRLG